MLRRRDHSAGRKAHHITAYPLLEDAVFSLLSLMVLLIAAALILTPPRLSFDLSVKSAYAAGWNIGVYGTVVNEAGQPIQGATVKVFGANGKLWTTVTTNARGEWVTDLKADKGAYTVQVSYMQNGRPVTGSIVMAMQQGMTYGVQAALTNNSTIVFVPVPGY